MRAALFCVPTPLSPPPKAGGAVEGYETLSIFIS